MPPDRERLCIWVIYQHPLDYPAHYVVRRQHVGPAGIEIEAIACLYDSLADARFDIPDGLIGWDERDVGDPAIIESWF